MNEQDKAKLRRKILNIASDQMMNFLYYGRKEDPTTPVNVIEDAIIDNVVEFEEIIMVFRTEIVNSLIARRKQRYEQEQQQSQGNQEG